MKLSDYIKTLQEILDKRGDAEILETSPIILVPKEKVVKQINPCRKFY